MNFNWRTDEVQRWDSDLPTPAESPAVVLRRLVLLIGVLAGFFLWRGVEQRAARNREALAQDVRAGHALAMRAAAQGDGELFTTLLSGREPRWTETQRTLLEEKLLFGAAAAPFGFEPADAAAVVTNVAWDPDLHEATVTTRHAYTLNGADLAGESAWLVQTHVYRRGADGWLLSPPDEAFWGPWRQHRSDFVTLHFRERDAAAVQAMAPALNRALAALCDELEQPCAQGAPFAVRLEPDGAALRRLQDDRYPWFLFDELSLPSPSLAGAGVDEPSQDALSRGYARYLIIAAAQSLLDFDCCTGAQFMDALTATMAHELGYGADPLQGADYVEMVDSLYSLSHFERLWSGDYESPFTDDERAQVAAFEAFLRRQSGATTSDMQRALAESLDFWRWVQAFTALDIVADRSGLEAAWRDFVFVQANLSQDAPSGLPAQTLKLICEDEAGQRALYDYDPVRERWRYEHEVRGRAPALVATPGDDGMVIFDRVTADPTRRPARLVRDGREIPISGDLAPAYSLPGDPLGRYMPMWRVSQSGRTIDGAVLLDLALCADEHPCRERSLPGLLTWSPDGSQMAVWEPDSGYIWIISRDLARWPRSAIRSSQQAFWLNDDTLGMVSEDGSLIQMSVLDLIFTDAAQPQGLLSLERALAALRRDGDGRNWRFAQAYRVPGAPAIVSSVTLPESGARHFFVAHFDEAWRLLDIKPLTYVPQVVVSSPDALISADGKWFSMHVSPMDMEEPRFVLHDLYTGDLVLDTRSPLFTTVRAHDWSADGMWLARVGIHHVELTTASGDPESPLLRKFISSGNLQCTSVAWVHR